jgi:preprotein translocase subunit SecE
MVKSLMVSFLREVRVELSKVTWPSKEDVIRLTSVIIGISVIVGAYIGGLDLIFTKMLEYIIK